MEPQPASSKIHPPNTRPLRGSAWIPGDKSISHRAVMLGAMAKGHTVVHNFLRAEDTLATIRCCRQLGVVIEFVGGDLHIDSPGCAGWSEPGDILDVGNSGTTLRLMLGMLASQPFTTTLTGDAITRQRPLGRVIRPLARMGAQFLARQNGECAPVTVRGQQLVGICWETEVASAQVKSALLLAGLQAHGATVLWEPSLSRNHAELMLPRFGARLQIDEESVSVMLLGPQRLRPADITIPGDFSAAAVLLVAALLLPGSDITLEGIGLNPTRTGLLQVLAEMGARPEVRHNRLCNGEPLGDLRLVFHPELGRVEVPSIQIPNLVDEIPVLVVAATQAYGKTIIRGVSELQVNEVAGLQSLAGELGKMGASIETVEDDLVISGPTALHPAQLDSHADHRLTMALTVADLLAGGGSSIIGRDWVKVSFPGFFEVIADLQA